MNKNLSYFLRKEKATLVLGVALGCITLTSMYEFSPSSSIGLEVHASSNEVVDEIKNIDLTVPTEEIKVIPANCVVTNTVVESVPTVEMNVTTNVGVKVVEQKLDTELIEGNVPNNAEGCKSWNITYMDYKKVTSETSKQYWFLNSDECYTEIETGLRKVGDRYCIALGSYYTTTIGQKVDLYFEDGTVLKCILGDCKADIHTDPTNRFHSEDGSVAEFIIDGAYLKGTEAWRGLCGGTIISVSVL